MIVINVHSLFPEKNLEWLELISYNTAVAAAVISTSSAVLTIMYALSKVTITLDHLLLYISSRFKRLTGRNEVTVSARDYKFYAPRHKYRRAVSNSNSNMPGLPVSYVEFFKLRCRFLTAILNLINSKFPTYFSGIP